MSAAKKLDCVISQVHGLDVRVTALEEGGGGGGGATDLTMTRTATTVTINSDTGTDAVIPVPDGTNAGIMLAAEKIKLAGIATGATNNSSDAFLLARANHTGTQAVATITGLGSLATLSAAPAGTLTGSTLAAGVTASNLTSVGTLATLTVTATINGSVSGSAVTSTTAALGTSSTAIATTAFVVNMLAGWNNIIAESTTARTIGLTDAGKYIRCSNAGTVTITIPTNAVTAFPIGSEIIFRRLSGAGAFALSNAGVTVNNSALAATIAVHGSFGLKKVATDEWDVI